MHVRLEIIKKLSLLEVCKPLHRKNATSLEMAFKLTINFTVNCDSNKNRNYQC